MTQSTHKSNPILMVGDTSVVFDFQDNDFALFVCLGAALTEIQVFEGTLLNHLTIFRSNLESKDMKSMLEQNIDKTLGQLARLFIEVVKDDEIGNLLIEVRDKRNFLVHKILSKYGWPLMSDDDFLTCYKEIGDIRDFIYQAKTKLDAFLNSQRFTNAIVIAINPKTGKPFAPGRDDLNDLFTQETNP